MHLQNPLPLEAITIPMPSLSGETIIAILSVLIAGLSLMVTARSERASGNSAAAAKESATAAREAVNFQKQQWEEYKTAKLTVGFATGWRSYWAKTPEDHRVDHRIRITNSGFATAHRVVLDLEGPDSSTESIEQIRDGRVLADDLVEVEVNHGHIPESPVSLLLTIVYEDGIGAHMQFVRLEVRVVEQDPKKPRLERAVVSSHVKAVETKPDDLPG